MQKNFKYLPSFGRRKGRKLTPQRCDLMAEFRHVFIDAESPHPNLLPEGEGMHGASSPSPSGSRAWVEGNKETWLEIGFGSGEHLAALALKNPEINFVGAETFIDGCGALIKKIAADNIKNIRIWNEDARILLAKLPENSVSRAFILFPDPWPKRRQNKRRIINNETLNLLARIIKKDGRIRLATDHPAYADWMIMQIFNNKNFRWLAESKKDWEAIPEDHITTRYQQKSLAGTKHYFLELEKN